LEYGISNVEEGIQIMENGVWNMDILCSALVAKNVCVTSTCTDTTRATGWGSKMF